jgi:hypothetical protein
VANLFQAGVAPPGSHLESLQRCRVPTYETSADPAIGTSVAIPRRDKAAIAKRDSALGGDAMTTTSEQRRSVSWLLALVGLMTTALAAAPAAATVFTVNDNGDAGDANPGDGVCATAGVVCTLRAAIDETNALAAGAPHDIRFSGALTIATASNFTVTRAGTVVDGITGNPDFAGTPVVEIDGSPGGGTALLVLDGGAATLRGLVVRGRAGNAGILLQSAANVVRGCYVGTNAAGTAAAPNGLGIAVAGDGATANVIGGTSPGDGNVISGQSPGTGIDLHNTTSNVIQGNFIGTDVSGTVAIPNTFGINIEVLGGNVIGGAAAGEGHVISGNDNTGLRISGANGNVVEGNLIGLDATGAGDLGNGNQGIRVDNAILNTIGGLAAGAGNVIAGNGDVGIRLASASSTTVAGNTIGLDASGTVAIGNVGGGVHVFSGAANRITRNRIASTVAGLAIDLDVDGVGSGDGVTPNDALDVDTGTNELQNFPVLNSALAGGGTTAIAGTLSSLPATTFTVELFASPSCHSSGNGDARTFLGATDVTTDGSGVAAVDYLHPAALVPGTVVTATATRSGGQHVGTLGVRPRRGAAGAGPDGGEGPRGQLHTGSGRGDLHDRGDQRGCRADGRDDDGHRLAPRGTDGDGDDRRGLDVHARAAAVHVGRGDRAGAGLSRDHPDRQRGERRAGQCREFRRRIGRGPEQRSERRCERPDGHCGGRGRRHSGRGAGGPRVSRHRALRRGGPGAAALSAARGQVLPGTVPSQVLPRQVRLFAKTVAPPSRAGTSLPGTNGRQRH